MAYQEKRTISGILSGALVLAGYCIYVLGRYESNMVDLNDLRFCGLTMLIFIGIGIVVNIVIQILFHIVFSIGIAVKNKNCDEKAIEKEMDCEMVEDEMDKLIELKAMKAGFIISGVGFVAALFLLRLISPGGDTKYHIPFILSGAFG